MMGCWLRKQVERAACVCREQLHHILCYLRISQVAILTPSLERQLPTPSVAEEDCTMKSALYYGDNLDLLRNRKFIRDESVDLCYIDPPFNSKRRYNRIYNNRGGDDRAQAQAFIDIHTWEDHAIRCYEDIRSNANGAYTAQTIDLILGLEKVLKRGPLFAYLVSMTARIVEIHRVLKPTGSFYLHCDPNASHYLKIITDSVFLASSGEFLNEIVWCYSIGGKSKKRFGRKHDVLLYYTKVNDDAHTFNLDGASIPRKPNSHMRSGIDPVSKRAYQEKTDRKSGTVYRYYLDEGKIAEDYWTDIETLNREDRERVGWPTQKPEALLSRIIKTSSNDGDLVLDAFCGCGTTIAVAQRLNRRWIGIDITYQAISTILNRLEDEFPTMDLRNIVQNGIPRDMESAYALAHKKDDRLRKEFEKWAILTYCNNKAVINEKKGADGGIDGIAYILTGDSSSVKMVLQAKSGAVNRGDIAKLQGDMGDAELAVLITYEEPTKPMKEKAKAAGTYTHELTGRICDRISIITVEAMIEKGVRLDLPQDFAAFKAAVRQVDSRQMELPLSDDVGDVEPKKPVASVIPMRDARVQSGRQ
jgi:DNA modification methylase